MGEDAPEELTTVNEGGNNVLGDVLDELDRERTRRAELEDEILNLKKTHLKHLQKEQKDPQGDQTQSSKQDDDAVSRQKLIAIETERDGYKELVDVLTTDNDAVSAAMRQEHSLPLHIVRMLEVMPYDPRVIASVRATDEVYEWQVYKGGQWQGSIRHFPPVFRKLPIVQPKHGSVIEEATSRKLFLELPPKQCVLTNEAMTKIIKLDNGYSLPEGGGTWEWVSGWRVDKRMNVDDSESMMFPGTSPPKTKVDCDNEGWSYAEDARHFLTDPTQLCWDNAEISDQGKTAKRPNRRRKWTRQRSLVAYPHASENAIHYLQLLCENARMSVASTKLSDQLVETKTRLTEVEDNIVSMKAEHAKETETLKKELKLRDKTILDLLEGNGEAVTPRKRSADLRLPDIEKMKSAAGGFASSLVSSASNATFFRKTSDADKVVESLRKQTHEKSIEPVKSTHDCDNSSRKESVNVDDNVPFPVLAEDEDKQKSSDSSPLNSPEVSYGGFAWRNIGRNPLMLASIPPAGISLLQGLRKVESKEEAEKACDNERQKDDGKGNNSEDTSKVNKSKKKQNKKLHGYNSLEEKDSALIAERDDESPVAGSVKVDTAFAVAT